MNKNEWKDFFSYTKIERRGISILSILIFGVILINVFDPFNALKTYNFNSFEAKVINYQNLNDSISHTNKINNTKNKVYKSKQPEFTLKFFNPNEISETDWLKMGLKKYQAKSIIKYISKGGRFDNPDELRKMYCLSKDECDKLIPFVVIDEVIIDEANKEVFIKHKPKLLSLELNTVGFDSLLEVNGIGPVTAKGIIKYRNILGGYYSVSQLKEVYSIDSARFEKIKANFYTNSDSLKPLLLLNEADFFELKRHPYISNRNAYEIIEHRNSKGKFSNIEELRKVKSINDSIYQKIYRYFAITK